MSTDLPPFSSLSDREEIVAMVSHNSRLFVAVTRRVYEVVGDELVPLKFRRVEQAVKETKA